MRTAARLEPPDPSGGGDRSESRLADQEELHRSGRSLIPPRRRLTVTANRVGARGMVRIIELDDDLDVGIEVGPGTPNPEFRALGLGADRVTQEIDKAPALPKCPPGIVALARGSRSFTSGSRSQRYEVSGHLVHAFLWRSVSSAERVGCEGFSPRARHAEPAAQPPRIRGAPPTSAPAGCKSVPDS